MASLGNFGLTGAGLSIPRQSDWTAMLNAAWTGQFGSNVNLDPRSVNGQIINIVSERLALVSELLEAIYNASYPAGAEGVSVDNILALNGLTRLPATATVTQPAPLVEASGITLYGLVLLGVPGTVVPAGTRVASTAQPPVVMSLNTAVAIAASANAVQTIAFSNAPTSGAFSLTLTDAAGTAYTTPLLPYSAQASDMQTAIQALTGASGATPYTDVSVAAGAGIVVTFGAGTPAQGAPASGSQPQALIQVASNSLQAGSAATNISVSTTQQGAPAQGIGSATAISTGSQTVPAGTLTVVQTPLAGLTGVTNQLDCIAGSDVETDAQALARRSNSLSAQAKGPVAAMVQAVESVAGVTGVQAFTNTSNAAEQMVTLAAGATTGTFQLYVGQAATSPLPYNVTATQMQSAIQALPGFAPATVVGNPTYGFTVRFNASAGGQGVPLMQVANNSTGVAISAAFGRAPKSVELVVSGGSNQAVAQAIFAAAPGGITTYAAPVLVTTGSPVAGSATLTVASTSMATVGLSLAGYGIQPGATVASISGNQVTMSTAALGSYSNVGVTFSNATLVTDANGFPHLVGFSRPALVPIYVSVSAVTDTFIVPGVPGSGINAAAKWSPSNVGAIQQAVVTAGSATPIGGTIIALGTNGLVNSLNAVPGIVSYQLTFGVSPTALSSANVPLLSSQEALFLPANIAVSYT